ncbi:MULTISPECIES: acyl-CoA dehydrogenase family protein [unclassified Saccharothrix]|uniref:acyl-CoA dehydrogenase family protein n=1 Tax=unclassified Saccharothrix TaxID=2593673 RepID=UPI00307FA575
MPDSEALRSVLGAVQDIVPVLRRNGLQAENERMIPAENIDLQDKAGVFRMAVPRRFGGLELPLADKVAVLSEIARGCPSSGWLAETWASNAWIATLYPDRAQEEVFANGSVRVSSGFAPTGRFVPVDGGYRLNGRWGFNSGCLGAHWNVTAGIVEGTGARVLGLVPMSKLTTLDDWDVSGGAATGSVTTVAEDVFVPWHRVLDFDHALANNGPGRTNGGADGRSYGLVSMIMAECAAVFTGIARGAYELFMERLPGRGITYTSWTDQKLHPLTQVQVATAKNKIDAAEAMSRVWLDLLQERADAGELPTVEERAIVRGQTMFAGRLAQEAVEILYSLSGGSVIQRSVPLQRFHRDIQAFMHHGLTNVTTNLEVQGRVLLGLDPDTTFL